MPFTAPAFDSLADAYDASFTATTIGATMRSAVWVRCAARFRAGSHVLEMNCGTGEDALWLVRRGVRVVATDVSSAMLNVARAKVAAATTEGLARFRQLAWEDLETFDEGPFDGMLSNFGGLNCVKELRGPARALASKLRPGALAILCVMGPAVPWEWAWFLAQGKPASAFRRLRRGGAEWQGIAVRYPSIGRVRRAFAPEFRMLRVSALGALVPPPYTENWIVRHPRLLTALNNIERRFETVWPLPPLADHYVMELERV